MGSATDLQGSILLRTLGLAGLGLALGMAVSRVLTGTLASLLFGVTPGDPVTFVGMGALLLWWLRSQGIFLLVELRDYSASMESAVQITMYLTEGDPWNKVLELLHDEQVAGASAFHAVAGFVGRNSVSRASLVEAGGKLPVIVTFVDLEEHVQRVLPKLSVLVPHRLIVREKVQIEQGSLD